MVQIGVDFGGTKIEAAALDDQGRILSRLRVPNPGGYGAAIREIHALVLAVENKAGPPDSGMPATIGIGTPGSISPRTGLMRNANSLYLNGRRFREDLEFAIGRPVRMANDANCLALSEAVDGAAAGARSAFAVIVGTGSGGGLVVDGRSSRVPTGSPANGGMCRCRGRPQPNFPVPCVGAASMDVSKVGCRAPDSAAITSRSLATCWKER